MWTQWGRIGINTSNFPPKGAALPALVFHGSVAATFGVLVWYWLELNIFQALGYLSILAVVAIFSGKATLSAVASSK